MTHEDWLVFVKVIIFAGVIFYLRVWLAESARAGSWRKGHDVLWKKPKRWQLVTFCVLWGFIVVAFIVLIWNQRPK
jgi:hypothetical protein